VGGCGAWVGCACECRCVRGARGEGGRGGGGIHFTSLSKPTHNPLHITTQTLLHSNPRLMFCLAQVVTGHVGADGSTNRTAPSDGHQRRTCSATRNVESESCFDLLEDGQNAVVRASHV
jgi:hypothetical protein